MQLKKWHLNGTAKLTFKPLTSTIPGFGAVLVSLTEVVSTISYYVASQFASFVGVVITFHAWRLRLSVRWIPFSAPSFHL